MSRRSKLQGWSGSGWGGHGYDQVVADNVNYVAGAHYAFLSPWGAGTYTSPADYEDALHIVSADFPSNLRIDTRWPTVTSPFGVWGYMYVAYGWYNGNTKPPGLTQPTAIRAGSFSAFSESFDWSYSGSLHFNLLNEFYLTTSAGVLSGKTHEIGFFLHTPPETLSWHNASTNVGTYTDDQGRTWSCRKSTPSYVYIHFVPTGAVDIFSGSINFKHALDWLVTNGQIDGLGYVNGVGFGMEPTDGAGVTSLTINSFAMTSFA